MLVNMVYKPEKSGIEFRQIYRSFIKDIITESGFKPVDLPAGRQD